MGKIILLDDSLSNKIAAGEVVERPASIVKELVENAIDAGSTVIEIFIEAAGLKSIRIVDNGDGIGAEDVLRAFERHATSKIKNEQDLFRIRTLGFRGEALPSIASVSHLEMRTSTGEGMGTRVVIEGGKILTHEGASLRKGTDITVSNIFFNTPARLKYLKSEATELGTISDVVNRLAISHPEVSFKLVSNEKSLLKTAGNGNLAQVFASIYGLEAARKMVPVHGESLDFTIDGLLGLPEMTRASRSYITILVNGRYIKNFLITKAILDGYHTLLPINRYPYALINIILDPYLVDVNVHPSKMEVRISKEKELMELVMQMIREKMQELSLIPSGIPTIKKEKHLVEQTMMNFHEKNVESVNENLNKRNPQSLKDYSSTDGGFYKENPQSLKPFKSQSQFADRPSQKTIDYLNDQISDDNLIAEKIHHEDAYESNTNMQNRRADNTSEKHDEEQKISTTENAVDVHPAEATIAILNDQANAETASEPKMPKLYAIGQLHGTYILAQNEIGLYIIDQHAAQERMKYEFFKVKLAEVDQSLQDLLIPITLEFPSDKVIKLTEYLHVLSQIGVCLESFGANSYIIRATPVWFPNGAEDSLIEELIEQVIATKKVDIGKIRESAAIMMSCKGSIKANHHLRMEEMQTLLDDLGQTSDPFTCPHGRPVIIQFSQYELEKMFKRVMG